MGFYLMLSTLVATTAPALELPGFDISLEGTTKQTCEQAAFLVNLRIPHLKKTYAVRVLRRSGTFHFYREGLVYGFFKCSDQKYTMKIRLKGVASLLKSIIENKLTKEIKKTFE
jgi:hypothetical protein